MEQEDSEKMLKWVKHQVSRQWAGFNQSSFSECSLELQNITTGRHLKGSSSATIFFLEIECEGEESPVTHPWSLGQATFRVLIRAATVPVVPCMLTLGEQEDRIPAPSSLLTSYRE